MQWKKLAILSVVALTLGMTGCGSSTEDKGVSSEKQSTEKKQTAETTQSTEKTDQEVGCLQVRQLRQGIRLPAAGLWVLYVRGMLLMQWAVQVVSESSAANRAGAASRIRADASCRLQGMRQALSEER